MESVRVKSWNDLVEATFADSFSQRLQRYRSPFAFRGMCADWPLTNSLQRLRHDVGTLGSIERAMFRNFKKYAYADFEKNSSDWKWLAVAQHHGLPTRLLDWTFSPFVAMHFATNELDKMDKDGVLWMVNFDEARTHLPQFFQSALHRHYAMTFSVEMLEEDDDLKDPFRFEQTEGQEEPFVLFFEPPSLDPRIVNQWGLFSFTNRLDVRLDAWLLDKSMSCPNIVRKIVIDADAKWEIRDKLDGMNLTERVLMPGLDGLSTWLKRWYSPKIPHPVAVSQGPVQASLQLATPGATPSAPAVKTPSPRSSRTKSGATASTKQSTKRSTGGTANRAANGKASAKGRGKVNGAAKRKPSSTAKPPSKTPRKVRGRSSSP